MSALTTRSRSQAEDAAHRATAAIAHAVDSNDYRLIGGQMVTLLVARHRPSDAPERSTADADAGIRRSVVATGAFIDALDKQGYRRQGGNRFVRGDNSIDVLIPAATSRVRHNRPIGDLFVDEAAGLSFALSRPDTPTTVDVALTDSTELAYTVSLPDPLSALVLKALAWQARHAEKDVIDIHRCLTVARVVGVTADSWPAHGEADRARRLLRQDFARGRPTSVRLLIAAVCGPLTPRPPPAQFG